jgi:ParB family transcriptional regulator, chromosome partitioning protein
LRCAPTRRAAQLPEAGPLTHLLAVVVDVPAGQVLARATAENLGRADMTVIEEAAAFHRLATDDGFTHQEIADMVGKSVQYVRYRTELLNLVPAAKEALTRGHMSVNTAWYVCRLSINAQHTFLRKLARGEFSNADAAAAFAQACREREVVDQGGLFDVVEMSDEEREQVAARRRTIVRKVDQLGRAGAILHDLASADPVDLARLLAAEPGGVAGYIQRLDALRDTAAKAVSKLVKARAVAEAATVTAPARPDITLFN